MVGPATSRSRGRHKPGVLRRQARCRHGLGHECRTDEECRWQAEDATPAFFRVVADDSVQGVRDAKYMIEKLGAKKVAVFDAQEPYSQGLADTVEAYLKGRALQCSGSRSPTRRLTSGHREQDRQGHGRRVHAVPDRIERADRRGHATRDRQKGCCVRPDGTIDPAFKFPGSFVSNFAPDLNLVPEKKALVAQWKKDNPGRTFSALAPTAYGAAEVIMRATKKACIDGRARSPGRTSSVGSRP